MGNEFAWSFNLDECMGFTLKYSLYTSRVVRQYVRRTTGFRAAGIINDLTGFRLCVYIKIILLVITSCIIIYLRTAV